MLPWTMVLICLALQKEWQQDEWSDIDMDGDTFLSLHDIIM